MVATDEKLYGPLLPLKEGAEFLGVSLRTLRQWIQLGHVESHKLYGKRLISEDEVIRLIELSRVPALPRNRKARSRAKRVEAEAEAIAA